MNRKNEGIIKESRLDYGIILSVLILAIIGILSVYSTTVMIEGKNLIPTLYHILWYGVGTIVVIFLIQLNSEQYWRLTNLFYAIGVAGLILTLLFYDRQLASETGARSWIVLGGLSFQPSEVFKPAYILMLAKVITQHNSKYIQRTLKTDWLLIGKALAITLPPAFLINLQNDLGTTLVVLTIMAGMIMMSGVSWKILLPVIVLGLGAVSLVIYLAMYQREFLLNTGILQPYQLQRIDIWLNPFGDTQNASYQLVQSIKAIGSGQLTGKGFGISEVPVPVRESDFIFTTIAENFGFLGSAFLLFIYFVLIYQMVQTCFKLQNEFYTYITTGVISMILFHVFENVGMNIGLLPITGVPLPFISQGGSALLSNMIGVGLVLSMRYNSQLNQ